MSTFIAAGTARTFSEGVKLGGRKSDQAYHFIKRAIVLHDLAPGVQLREQNLAREFECSQGTVREALLRLTDDGLVARRGYKGTFVTDTSLAEVSEMVRVRLSIERRAARMICRRAPNEIDLTALELILAGMDEAHLENDFFRGSELDRAFHAEVTRLAGLGLLSPVLQRCALHIHRFTLSNIEVPREFSQEAGIGNEHRALLNALVPASEENAEAAIVSHLQNVLRRWAPSIYQTVGPKVFELLP